MRSERFAALQTGLRLPLAVGLLFALLACFPVPCAAAPTIPGFYGGIPQGALPAPGALPVLRGVDAGVASVGQTAANRLEVHQESRNAVISWSSFNVGQEAAVHFNQEGNADWAALNRIYDRDPSVILGRLTADGKVFLVNRNGILFGPEARVNLYSLVASALDVGDADFLDGDGNLSFYLNDYIAGKDPASFAVVSNHGAIETDVTGSVFLVGPYVENYGTIDAPGGRVELVAGSLATIAPGSVQSAGSAGNEAVNAESGRITADTGYAGMTGGVVRQDGLIRSVTAVKANGKIVLRASERVVTGPNSRTETPISESPDEVHESFTLQGGQIEIGGGGDNPDLIEHGGVLSAPSGNIRMEADRRIFLDADSEVDVGGEWVDRDAGDVVVEVQLNSQEMRDEYLQKQGVLFGETVWVDSRVGSAIGDISQYLDSEEKTARELATGGGAITMRVAGGRDDEGHPVTGEIVVQEGARIDFSGGGNQYEGGAVLTTKVASGKRVYDIGEAPDSILYDRVLGTFEKRHERYGVVDTYVGHFYGGASAVGDSRPAHVEGSDAGTLIMEANRLVLNGDLTGAAEAGYYQTLTEAPVDDLGNLQATGVVEPLGGRLILGSPYLPQADPQQRDSLLDEVVLQGDIQPLPENFQALDPLPVVQAHGTVVVPDASEDSLENPPTAEDFHIPQTSYLSTEKLNAAELGELQIWANTKVTLAKDAVLSLPARAVFQVGARSLEHRGTIDIPGGTVDWLIGENLTAFPAINNQENLRYTPLVSRVFLDRGSVIDLSGETVDNSLAGLGLEDLNRHRAIDGGSLTIEDRIEFSDGVVIKGADPGAQDQIKLRDDDSAVPEDWIAVGDGAFLVEKDPHLNRTATKTAAVDVSGGYLVGADGAVSAGNAGTVDLTGSAIVVDGSLKGYGLMDAGGGTLRLRADEVIVTAEAAKRLPGGFAFTDALSPEDAGDGLLFQTDAQGGVPIGVDEDGGVHYAEREGRLILAGDRFAGSGFSHIDIQSGQDLTLLEGAVVAPSYVRLADPESRKDASGFGRWKNHVSDVDAGLEKIVAENGERVVATLGDHDGLVIVKPGYAGATSVRLAAGRTRDEGPDFVQNARLTVAADAVVRVAPEGDVALSGQEISVSGTVEAPAGDIALTQRSPREVTEEPPGVVVAGGAVLSTAGAVVREQWLQPVDSLTPVVNRTVLDGGTISLEAGYGSLVVDRGALLDADGSPGVDHHVLDSEGRIYDAAGRVRKVRVAGAPGAVDLRFFDALQLDGDVKARAAVDGLHGGAISIGRINQGGDLEITDELVDRIAAMEGMDALTLHSEDALVFSDATAIGMERSITLDAPVIAAGEPTTGPDRSPPLRVELAAPLITVRNTYWPSDDVPEAGKAALALSADWIDVEGKVVFDGFETLGMKSGGDIRFADIDYTALGERSSGGVVTGGDLRMRADRIYPTTLSGIEIAAGGDLSILPGDGPGDGMIYSAGGSMALTARNIDHRGVLAAPMGRITLQAVTDASSSEAVQGRIHLGGKSRIDTSGDRMVSYGDMVSGSQGELFWVYHDKAAEDRSALVEAAPVPAVSIQGEEVVVREGAQIDVSGGGGVFGHAFLQGLDGSENPFAGGDRYVILPAEAYPVPGETVVFSDPVALPNGATVLPAGTYTIVPEEMREAFAFAPGAVVISAWNGRIAPGEHLFTPEGYPVATASIGVAGTGFVLPLPGAFTVRTAEEMMKEGYFEVRSLTAGDGGDLEIAGETGSIGGTFTGAGLEGYRGGRFAAVGREMVIRSGLSGIPPGLNILEDPLDAALGDGFELTPAALEGGGFDQLELGDLDQTETVTIGRGTALGAQRVVLAGKRAVTLESGARVHAVAREPDPLYPLSDAAESFARVAGTLDVLSSKKRGEDGRGVVTIGPEAELRASDGLFMQLADFDARGRVVIDNGELSLASHDISFGPAGADADTVQGLVLTEAELAVFGALEDLTLKADSDIRFFTDFTLAASASLTLDAATIGSESDVVLRSPAVHLLNTGAQKAFTTDTHTGSLLVDAETITIGRGDVRMDGFRMVDLNSGGDLVFQGAGSLAANTKGGALTLTAARVVAEPYVKVTENETTGQTTRTIEPAFFRVLDAESAGEANAIAIRAAEGSDGTGGASIPGGSLLFRSERIDLSGVVDMPGGNVTFDAGGGGVFLAPGARVQAGGGIREYAIADATASQYYPGGTVSLSTDGGRIEIASGAQIDVSNTAKVLSDTVGPQSPILAAGTVSLEAPAGDVVIEGILSGGSVLGEGGRFGLDARDLPDFGPLSRSLIQGGFDGSWDLRSRTGDIVVGAGEQAKAREIRLAADDGEVRVHGVVDATGPDGGTVALFAGADLTLFDGSRIDASATGGGDGGRVLVSTLGGTLGFESGASIDVGGGSEGEGGQVHFRAGQIDVDTAPDVDMTLSGAVTGAGRVVAEAVRLYDDVADDTVIGPGGITATVWQQWQRDAENYMNAAPANAAGRFAGLDIDGGGAGALHFLPGIEVRSDAALLEVAGVDLGKVSGRNNNADWRYGESRTLPGEPGVLTIRAGGRLILNGSIADAVDTAETWPGSGGADSWDIRLVAGADLTGADPLVTDPSSDGWLILNGDAMVHSRGGTIRFASSGRTILSDGGPGMMVNGIPYSIGSYSGDVIGRVGGFVNAAGDATGFLFVPGDSAVQTATGDIDIAVDGDLLLIEGQNALGSIRTTGGEPPENPEGGSWPLYWEIEDGGDIRVSVGGDVTAGPVERSFHGWYGAVGSNRDGWTWSPSYMETFSDDPSFATDGLVTLGGGDILITVGGDFQGQAGTFGPGDLDIYANGNLNGRFLVNQGTGTLTTGGSFGKKTNLGNQTIELADAKVSLTAVGDIALGSVVNPSLTQRTLADRGWNLTYGQDASVALTALTGDVTISGESRFITRDLGIREQLWPPNLAIQAANDILLGPGGPNAGKTIVLSPAADGDLSLTAGGDIDGEYITQSISGESDYQRTTLLMSDADPGAVYGVQTGDAGTIVSSRYVNHDPDLLHEGDATPVRVHAGGDVANLQLVLPKSAEIIAGGSIRDIYYLGQNLEADDVSVIRAGEEIFFQSRPGATFLTGIEQGGPGNLVVQAGNAVDLGSSQGIQTVGNLYNPALDPGGSDLVLLSGFDGGRTADEVDTFLDRLRNIGYLYTLLKNGAAADDEILRKLVFETRDTADYAILSRLAPHIGNPAAGTVNLPALISEELGKIGFRREPDQVLDLLAALAAENAGQKTFENDLSWKGLSASLSGAPLSDAVLQWLVKAISGKSLDAEILMAVIAQYDTEGLIDNLDAALGLDAALEEMQADFGQEGLEISFPVDLHAELTTEGSNPDLAQGLVKIARDKIIAPFYRGETPDTAVAFRELAGELGIDLTAWEIDGVNDLTALGDRDPRMAAMLSGLSDAERVHLTAVLNGTENAKGDIEMITSKINTSAESADVSMLSAGTVNVGRSFIAGEGDSQQKNTGIFTSKGGGINIYTELDANVLESRVMTFFGGDITVWGNRGDINAGRGGKTAVNASPPERVFDPVSGTYLIKFNPPAVGSGIRAVTYDPDDEGPKAEPPAGDIFLFAPKGVIDAGEAGIAGRNVILGATEVTNVQNISFSEGSAGVPLASDAAADLGALSGAGSLSDVSKAAQQTAGMEAARRKAMIDAGEMADQLMPKWINIRVLSLEDEFDD